MSTGKKNQDKHINLRISEDLYKDISKIVDNSEEYYSISHYIRCSLYQQTRKKK